jgi:hypothetical protein
MTFGLVKSNKKIVVGLLFFCWHKSELLGVLHILKTIITHGFKEKWVGRELGAAAEPCPLLNSPADPEVAVQQKHQILA